MRDVRPTRRGFAVAGLAAVAVVAGLVFGPRALDALVVATAVAFVAAALQLRTLDPPSVVRTPPPGGTPGTTGEVSLRFSTATPVTAVVTDTLPPGLDGDPQMTTVVGDGSVTYDVTYEVTYRERGEHVLGPVRIAARDVLGLAERTFVDETRTSVVVYPRVYHPATPVAERLRGLTTRALHGDRGTFDHLREYTHGDSLRDVHWKSSAKRDDLVVREFAADRDRTTVTVRARSAPGHADAMAEATATVCCALLDDGVGVALATPDGRVRVAPDGADRLLDHLARVGAGDPVPEEDVDVVVDADANGTHVHVDGDPVAFGRGRRRAVVTSGTDTDVVADAGSGERTAADAGLGRGSA